MRRRSNLRRSRPRRWTRRHSRPRRWTRRRWTRRRSMRRRSLAPRSTRRRSLVPRWQHLRWTRRRSLGLRSRSRPSERRRPPHLRPPAGLPSLLHLRARPLRRRSHQPFRRNLPRPRRPRRRYRRRLRHPWAVACRQCPPDRSCTCFSRTRALLDSLRSGSSRLRDRRDSLWFRKPKATRALRARPAQGESGFFERRTKSARD